MSGSLRPELDHIVFAVSDLQAAHSAMLVMGFTVSGGGEHPGFGTENLMVRLPGCYLELISVTDPAQARSAGRGTLVDALDRHTEGPVAFAVRGLTVADVIEHCHTVGIPVAGPRSMRRESDGRVQAAWQLGIPFGDQYCGWWPFFIEWKAGGPASAAYSVPEHRNGARRIRRLSVRTADLSSPRTLMESVLGLKPASGRDLNGIGEIAQYRLGDTELAFECGSESSPCADTSTAGGQGVHRVWIGAGKTRSRELGVGPVGAGSARPAWTQSLAFDAD